MVESAESGPYGELRSPRLANGLPIWQTPRSQTLLASPEILGPLLAQHWGVGQELGPTLPAGQAVPETGQPGYNAFQTQEEIKKRVLDKIASGEAPDYQTIYGGGRFSDFSDHPRIPVPITEGPNKGQTSSAAGRYQFIGSTWDAQAKKLGLSDFSPQNQDSAAWDLAQTAYKKQTGKDLVEDAQSGKINWGALGNEWESLKGASSGPLPDGSLSAGGVRAPGAPGVASGGAGTAGSPSLGLAGTSTGDLSGGPDQSALHTLLLMQLMAPGHKAQQVDYDPWKLQPKIG